MNNKYKTVNILIYSLMLIPILTLMLIPIAYAYTFRL